MRSAGAVFAGLRARARVGIGVECLAVLGVALSVHVFASYGIDRWLHLELPYRAALALVFATVAVRILLHRLVRPLGFALDDDELALAIERVEPGLRQALISAVQFDRTLAATGGVRGDSVALMRYVVTDVEARVSQLRALRALDGRRVLRFVGLLAIGFAAVSTWAVAQPREAGIWFQRNVLFGNVAWPQDTHLRFVDVDPGRPLRLAEREDLTIRVRALGVVPERLELRTRFADGTRSERPMDRVGDDEFIAKLETLLSDAELQAFGGDGRTEVLRIELVPRPELGELTLTVRAPDYLGREPESIVPTGGEVPLVAGSRVALTARASKPLRTATLRVGPDQRVDCAIDADGRALRAELELPDPGLTTASLDVVDRDDLGPAQPLRLALRVTADTPPTLDFETRGIGTMITAIARIPGVLRLRDDQGLRAVTGRFRTTAAEPGPPEPGEQPAPPPEFEAAPIGWDDPLQVDAREQELGLTFDLQPQVPDADPGSERNRFRPGMLLALRFDATDARGEPGQGLSDVLTLRIVTRDTLLEDLRRRRGEQRREVERIVEQVTETRDVLRDIASPTDPATAEPVQARVRIESLARRQLALGRNVQTIAERYQRILDEMTNNRLFEPAVTRSMAARVVAPLQRLAAEDFPTSAELGERFAAGGTATERGAVVAAVDDILSTLQAVLAGMERTEDIAAIVESLRIVIRTEDEATRLIEELRDASGAGIFDPPGGEGGGRDGDRGNLDTPAGARPDRPRREGGR
ncbi:MAG: hypothetical protein IPM29_31925 [Planctomycetes bacterium]|nr:hypothetical protein [Planctomycetota bacterium]